MHDSISNNVIKKQIQLRNMPILTQEDWSHFQYEFEQCFPEFFHQLLAVAPRLTNAEMRYIMMRYLRMDNKLISKNLGISEDAIRMTLFRIRRKYTDTFFNDYLK